MADSDDERKREIKHGTVVFIAPTQHGKSTTIEKYYEAMTTKKPTDFVPNFVLGNGTTSASKNTLALPPIPAKYIKYTDWPSSDDVSEADAKLKKDVYAKFAQCEKKYRIPADLSDSLFSIRHELMLGGKGDYNAKCEVGESAIIKPDGVEDYDLKVTLVDTPGLDDTEGGSQDDVIMEALLDQIADGPDLLAFVFVVKAGQAWSGSFLQSAKRYWDQFPTFRENWIFVHTNCDAFAENFAHGNCYEEFCEIRKKELIGALTGVFTEDAGLLTKLRHVFIDTVGVMNIKKKVYQKKAEFQRLERAKNFNKLTGLLCSNSVIPTSELQYRKSNDNEMLDGTMVQLLEQRKQGIMSALDPLKKTYGEDVEKIIKITEDRARLKLELEDKRVRLAKIDKPGMLVKAKKALKAEQNFWGRLEGNYTIAVKYPKKAVKISVTKNAGYPFGECLEESVNFNQKSGETIYCLQCSAPWRAGYDFIVRLLVSSQTVYEKEIEQTKKEIEVLEAQLVAFDGQFVNATADKEQLSKEIDLFVKQTEFFAGAEHLCQQKSVPLKEWKHISAFYKWARSPEGQESIGNVNNSNKVIEQFLVVHNLLNKYEEVMGKKLKDEGSKDGLSEAGMASMAWGGESQAATFLASAIGDPDAA